MRWIETDKSDQRPRRLADRHYTRQRPGHPMWTRPGWTQILYLRQRNGREAAFCWWRPKWESGLPGTERMDGLRAIECALFRNETRFRSSDLIRDAVAAVLTWNHAGDTTWPDGLISGVHSSATAGGRAVTSSPGECFVRAGWEPFEHAGGRADLWLRCVELPTGGGVRPLTRQLALMEAA
jgi:hypothetical protein